MLKTDNNQISFQEILKRKRDYYGYTEAAIEFAAEEYLHQKNIDNYAKNR